jgi:sigma-54 specific flagellar transcriptional regulator A
VATAVSLRTTTTSFDAAFSGVRFPSGQSAPIQRVTSLIKKVAAHDSSVLILGESGTGKEVVARAIHDGGSRRGSPFVAVNCGAIPPDLLESELFGHEKGAFTGAYNARRGRFEIAEGGTLFLDEIGDMSLPMQVKLLRVLQERVFERVGNHQPIRCDVRIIAATHRNLEEYIAKGLFRGDLFYRLNVFPIEMPSLRERGEDLPTLIGEFIAQNEAAGRPRLQLKDKALNALLDYSWPGNVRELGNLIERLSVIHGNETVDVFDLPPRYRAGYLTDDAVEALLADMARVEPHDPPEEAPSEVPALSQVRDYPEARTRSEEHGYPEAHHHPQNRDRSQDSTSHPAVEMDSTSAASSMVGGLPTVALPDSGIDLKEYLIQLETRFIEEALERADGVVSKAARLLGLRRTTLVEKMRRFGMMEPETIE